jgi:hypothetical protein
VVRPAHTDLVQRRETLLDLKCRRHPLGEYWSIERHHGRDRRRDPALARSRSKIREELING